MTAKEYAADELRRIGRRLVSGSWSRSAKPMTAVQAIAVLVEAVTVVADDGVKSVMAEGRRRMRELAARWDGDDE